MKYFRKFNSFKSIRDLIRKNLFWGNSYILTDVSNVVSRQNEISDERSSVSESEVRTGVTQQTTSLSVKDFQDGTFSAKVPQNSCLMFRCLNH